MITFDDFQKLDLRIGMVISAEKLEGSDKLVKLVVDLGDEKRQILAGIAEFFPDLELLVGKEIPVLTNLEPKTFHEEESQGMMLAADVDGRPILLHPTEHIPPGSKIR
ncbi:MAG: methionine--tRNA ligase [bacterium]|nr:methionine--tRNA ligase [bacterium]